MKGSRVSQRASCVPSASVRPTCCPIPYSLPHPPFRAPLPAHASRGALLASMWRACVRICARVLWLGRVAVVCAGWGRRLWIRLVRALFSARSALSPERPSLSLLPSFHHSPFPCFLHFSALFHYWFRFRALVSFFFAHFASAVLYQRLTHPVRSPLPAAASPFLIFFRCFFFSL